MSALYRACLGRLKEKDFMNQICGYPCTPLKFDLFGNPLSIHMILWWNVESTPFADIGFIQHDCLELFFMFQLYLSLMMYYVDLCKFRFSADY